MSAYNPKFKEAFVMANTMYNSRKEDIQRFVFDYKIQEIYDANGDIYQQLTPFILIDFK